MQDTKAKGETFRDYFRRARHDAGVRRQIMRSAGASRSIAGWVAAALAAAALGLTLSRGLRGAGWVSTEVIACAILFVLCMTAYAKFGERISELEAMDEPGDPKP